MYLCVCVCVVCERGRERDCGVRMFRPCVGLMGLLGDGRCWGGAAGLCCTCKWSQVDAGAVSY